MLTKGEMQRKIDDEIIVDCYDEYEVSMGWYYYMEETLKFPFKAKAELKKRDGTTALTEVSVTGLASDEEGFMQNDFYLEIAAGEYLVNIAFSKLSRIKAANETLEAFAIWNYWNKR